MPDAAFIYAERIKLLDKTHTRSCEWEIVRNYNDFCEFIDKFGIPEIVSFDHDLDTSHMEHYFNVTLKTGVIEYENLKIPTGKHCAEYFVDKWKEAGKPKVYVHVHSANRWGQTEIKNVLKELL
jgi:hypothetical protein